MLCQGFCKKDGFAFGCAVGKPTRAIPAHLLFEKTYKAKFQAVMDIHSPSREFRRFGGFITQGLDIGILRTASRPIGTIGTWAGRLKDSFTNRVGQLRADVAARVRVRARHN